MFLRFNSRTNPSEVESTIHRVERPETPIRTRKPGHSLVPGFLHVGIICNVIDQRETPYRNLPIMSDKQFDTEPELEQTEDVAAEVPGEPIKLIIEARAHGWRVDHYLVRLYPNFSRAAFQRVLEDNGVLINGLPVKMSRQ